MEVPLESEKKKSSESIKTASSGSVSAKKRIEPRNIPESGSATKRSGSIGSSASSVPRRNSTGGLPERQRSSLSSDGRIKPATKTVREKTVTEPVRRSLPEIRRSSISALHAGKPVSATPVGSSLRTSAVSGSEVVKKPLSKPALSRDRVGSSTVDGSVRKTVGKVSSPSLSARSPTVSGGLRAGSVSSSSDRSSGLSGRRKVTTTPDSRNSRLIVLPQIEVKASDDLRLDLRGHRVRSLTASGLNLSSNLEFLYLRDNLLSTLEGVEVLTRVKVLDLSFNDFKGPGFEPLESCKVLQQLYLAGNQITSLASLPQLPNLEFLSVAQNKLKSLTMASQPRLQVLAASKNRISTLKGFPYLPVLEHLRLEENPILKMPHLEAASILLVGPTLKKFNDRDLAREEMAIAKRYPAHTALCIRDGWEFGRPEQAAESTFRFLAEKWKDHIPPDFFLKEASIDKPLEEDVCHSHFTFVHDGAMSTDPPLVLKYQWFCGDVTLSNFVPIPDATDEFYLPKHNEIGKVLKVECTPFVGETEYPSIFAISSRVKPGSGIPKVVSLEVHGELLEGSIIRGCAKVAWCGGTPGKGVASWLRRKWNSSPVVIVGAEEDEYQPTINDVDSSLVFMYTPVTEEGAKGEPQYKYTDFVRAAPPSVSNVRIVGDAVEGITIKGVGDYFGGREGPSKFEWLRKNRDTGDFMLVSAGTSEYTLTKEDVGCCLTFVYIPINFEGQEGKSLSAVSPVVKQAPPKVTNVKIIGDVRENGKVTATGIVTGGTEGSSRVQWYKTYSSTLDESNLEALSTSKVAKAFRIPLGAVGCYIVAKYTPMSPDGDSGESTFVITDRAVETLPPSLNFLSIIGDYSEDGILTASYGYVGGHEGKSIYNWYIHEVEGDFGSPIPGVSGLLQYRITKEVIGKFISFHCTPVRDDGVVGDERICMGQERIRPGSPRLLSLHIVGNAVEGTTLRIEKTYWGGEEGDSVYRWLRTSCDGVQSEIMGATTASYMPSIDDIGFYISVSCEPVRSDWARGPIVLSEQIGPIIPGPPTCHSLEICGSMIEGQRLNFNAVYTGGERGDCTHEWFRVQNNGVRNKISSQDFLDLTLDDVGACIELVYTPVCKDGTKGIPKNVVSDAISPADPKGIELIIPDCCEARQVTPMKIYFGGHEGVGEYIWYRTKIKLEGSALLNISNGSDIVICGTELTYKPTLKDVGSFLALYWVPTRADNACGESHTVIPEETTPQGCLWLSDIDQVVKLRHTQTIYIYKSKQNTEKAIETLKNSLSKILVHYYPVAGRYCYKEGGRIELNLNAKGAILLEAETTKTIHDYGDFSPSDSTMELVPIIDYNQPVEDIPLFVVQLTRFQNKHEGLAIGIAYSHPLSDGLGAIRLINSWAKIARGETLEVNELPFLDRTILKFSHTPLVRFEHKELKPLPLILGRKDTSEEKKKKTSATLLRLSPEQVDKLKKKANENDILAIKNKGSRPFSRYEAISSHIWKCASRARKLEENQESVVRFNADIRTRLVPSLPKNYFGNALTQTAAIGYVGEITSKPLGYVAQMIREATELVSDEFIRSQIDVIRGFEHLDDARKLFMGGVGENIPYFGNPNFNFTSWMSMPIYEADFGWGKPVYFGLAFVSPHDRAVILHSPDGDGSVLVCLHFQIALLELFKKFFYGDI